MKKRAKNSSCINIEPSSPCYHYYRQMAKRQESNAILRRQSRSAIARRSRWAPLSGGDIYADRRRAASFFRSSNFAISALIIAIWVGHINYFTKNNATCGTLPSSKNDTSNAGHLRNMGVALAAMSCGTVLAKRGHRPRHWPNKKCHFLPSAKTA